MKKLIPIFFTALLPLTAPADHKPHVHGEVQVSIGFDGTRGEIEIDAPSESIVGFEHKAKNQAQIKQRAEALRALEDHISEMIVFDPSLGCKIVKDKVEIDYDDFQDDRGLKGEVAHKKSGTHSEVEAEFDVTCTKPVTGTTVKLNFFRKPFHLKTVNVQVVADAVQKSFIHKKNDESLELK